MGPANAASRLRAAQVPVYGVTLGGEEPLPDIEVVSLEPPTFSVVGKAVQIPFTLRSTLAVDYQVEVELTLATGAVLKREVVERRKARCVTCSSGRPKRSRHRNGIVGATTSGRAVAREQSRGRVRVNKSRVDQKRWLWESTPRWEYRYLRNALERDPGVDVSCVLFHPGLSARGGGPNHPPRFP